jgi:predicted GTPase
VNYSDFSTTRKSISFNFEFLKEKAFFLDRSRIRRRKEVSLLTATWSFSKV